VLRGRFGDTTGRPYIEGRVYFPRFAVHGDVSFLVDTGADASLLSPTDVYQMRLDLGAIARTSEAQGVGGIVRSLVEPAVVVFSAPAEAIWAYRLDLEILPPEPGDTGAVLRERDPELSLKLPSLLGRDVLDRWRMLYDPPADDLSFIVQSWDMMIDRSRS
jgi:hypothetical protein